MHPSWSAILADADMDPRGRRAYFPGPGEGRGWFSGDRFRRWLGAPFRAQFAPVFRRLVPLCLLLLSWGSSLRGAVVTNLTQAALESAVVEGGAVTFASGGTISLTNEVRILRDTVLDAGTVSSMAFSATASNRLFYVTNGVSLTLIGVTLQNGRAPFGGAIWNDGGTVLGRRVSFTGNQAVGLGGTNAANPGPAGTGAYGGAVFNDGLLSLANAYFDKNSANGVNGTNATVDGQPGTSGGEAFGGAIFNRGTLVLTNAAFHNSAANGGNGGNGAKGPIVAGNWGESGGAGGHGAAAWGGAIYSTGAITADLVLFNGGAAKAGTPGTGGPVGVGFNGTKAGAVDGMGGSAADAYGGAIYATGPLTLSNATFIANAARGSNGGIGSQGSGSTPGATGRHGGHAIGGAVHASGRFDAVNTTFVANLAEGGDGGRGGNTSSSGIPRAGAGGNGGDAIGGAVFATSGGLVRYSTWAKNIASAGTNGLNGFGVPPTKPGVSGTSKGGSVASSNSVDSLALNSSILSDGVPANLSGTIIDAGYNLSSDNSVEWTLPTSRRGIDPLLVPVQNADGGLPNNGGLIPTVGLRVNSPAIDAGDPATMPEADARGVVRPVSGGPDIGAFERTPVFSVFGRLAEIYTNAGSTNVTNVLSGFAVWADNIRVTTDTNGVFAFTNLLASTYTVYPTNIGAGFTPSFRLVSIGVTNAANPTGGATNIDFLANRPMVQMVGIPRFFTTNQVISTNGSVVATNSIVSTNGNFLVLTNFALPGRSYRVQVNTNIATTNWLTIATNITGTGAVGTTGLTNFPGGERRFFRVVAP
jgi:hypothetical protein